jgi:hypothetical protein
MNSTDATTPYRNHQNKATVRRSNGQFLVDNALQGHKGKRGTEVPRPFGSISKGASALATATES